MDQRLFDDRIETTVGRLAFGDEFFTFPCDFINLTFCPGQAGNIVGNYIYNWPVSQWAAVAAVNFGSEGYVKAAIYDANPAYLDTTPNRALWPTFPGDSQGIIVPGESPGRGALQGSYQFGGWWNDSAAPNVATSINGEPILVSGLPGVPGHGRYGFSVLQKQVIHMKLQERREVLGVCRRLSQRRRAGQRPDRLAASAILDTLKGLSLRHQDRVCELAAFDLIVDGDAILGETAAQFSRNWDCFDNTKAIRAI